MSIKIPVKRTLWNTSMQEQDPLLTRAGLTEQQRAAITKAVNDARSRRPRVPEFLRAPTPEKRIALIQAACVSLRIALEAMSVPAYPDREQAMRTAVEALAEIEKAVSY